MKQAVQKMPTAVAMGASTKYITSEDIRKMQAERRDYRKQNPHNCLRVNDVNCKREGTAAYDRFMSAVKYLAKNKKATQEELLANTLYTKADLKHDMAKGYITFIPTVH